MSEDLDYEVREEEYINARDINKAPRQKEVVIDRIVSDIVGKEISVTDPRLISLIVKWKKAKGDDESVDNFLEQEDKIEELKKAFI